MELTANTQPRSFDTVLPGRRRGFTLLEVMITITIILILVSLTWPGTQSLMAWWDKATSLSNLAKIRAAKAAYIVDFGTGGIVMSGGGGEADHDLFRSYFFGRFAGYVDTCPVSKVPYTGMYELGVEATSPALGTGRSSTLGAYKAGQ